MNWNFTLKKCFKRLYLLFLAFFFFVHTNSHAQVSYIYANQLLGNNSHVAAPGNAVSVSTTDYATLESYGGIAINLGSYTGRIELGFPSTVPAGTTTYVRIQTDATLLNTLLGGGLGGALANLTGTIALGNHYFEVRAKETGNATPVFTASSINGFANENARLVYGANGFYYIAITPSVAYNSIEIEDYTNTLLLGTINTLRVYSAFHFSGSDICNPAFATSFDGTGGTVDILGVGGAGVSNPNLAIDNSDTTFSQVSQGVLTVAGTISQTMYFQTPSGATDQFHLVLQLDDPSLLNLGVSDGIKIEALSGTSVVYSSGLGSLVNLDLLGLLSSGAKTDVAFSPGQAFDRVRVTISSLVQLNVTKTVKIFDVYRSPAKPTAVTANMAVCGSQSVALSATTASTNELVWFNSLTGASVAVTAYNQTYSPTVTATTTYYVASRQIGCARLSERVPVTITVNALPIASDITISANVNASCAGVALLEPTTSLTGGVFKYYTDQNKTEEITNGFSGHPGLTYVKNNILGTLAISGLNASNTPRNYYIAVEVNGACENAVNTLAAVQVGLGVKTPLTVSAIISGCGFVNLRDAITNFDTSGATTYTFYDSSNNPITATAAANITTSGTYYIEAFNPADACISDRLPVVVTVNPLPTLQVTPATYTVNLGDSVTLQSTSNGTVTWYNQSGTALASNVAGPFTTAGYYTFTAVANNGLCSVSLSVTVNVVDPANCPVFLDRVYADTQTSGSIITGGVMNGTLAIDRNPQTFSTITTGLGLLGIGTTWQNIQWNTTIPSGTPVTVKVGSEYSGLALLGAVSIIGTKRDGLGNPIDIGTLQQLSGTLLNLLPGENNFEYTFVPSNNTGPKAYDGIRIVIGSVLSVAQSARIYEAYYHKVADPVVCQPGDVEDVFYGNIDLGIGALTSTVGVTNAWNAVDNNHATFATMTTGVGVLAASELTVKFRSPSQENDVVKVRISRPSTILNLGLIAGFSIQRYMGNNPVGPLLDGNGSLLTLQLLNGGTEALLISNAQSPVFDRVRIRFGGVASVLNGLQVHSVTREAAVDVVGSGGDRIIEVCYGDVVSIAPIDCTTFNWYDAETGGNLITSGTSYTIPYSLAVGTHVYYLQPVRSGCEVLDRTPITITVRPTSPQTSVTGILINSATNTTICSPTGAVSLTAQLNSTPAVTNPVYYWYSFDGTNQTVISGQSTATLALTGLAPGTYTYYVGVSSDQFCATLPAERRSVTFTILPSSIATDITVSDVQACLVNPAPVTIQPTTTLTNPVFTWYFTNDVTQPITNGTVSGVTYSIAANGTLTISGLTTTNSPYTYYVAVTSETTCQNLPGTLQDVVVRMSDAPTPTTNDTTQDFCVVNNPTVASIQVNETGVIWYNAPTGGTVVTGTTPLVTGTYYGVLVDAVSGCESSVRLAVAVQVNDAPTPTTNDTTQDFCQSTNPTVASIQVNETGVIWYNAPTGGTVVTGTTPLVTGTYYGVLVDATSGCESSVRLAVAVQINDAPTPTTNDTTQDFCQSTNPTVASIQVNETGVIWYNAPTGGTVVASTTPLVTGTYYGVLVDATSGCESSVRLAVAVQVNDAPTPTTNDTTQDFCQSTNPTVASIQVNETGVIWYNAPTGGTVVASTTPLVTGTYYGVLVDATSGCESSVRLAVAVQINDAPTPTTNDTTQDFCQSTNPTVASIQVNETGVIWYNAPTGGTVVTSTTPLVTGTYYGVLVDATSGCESSVRLAVAVQVNDAPTPTTNDTTQDFCQSTNPTVASIQVNETGVIWYNAPTGGTVVASTTPLVTGTYYGVLVDATSGCESSVRLAVAVQVNDAPTPTTNDTTQDFCQSTNPTVASIQVNETGVIWYNAPTGGTVVTSTTPLVTGTYYGVLVDATSGCESSVRLAVAVQINDAPTPTTNDTTQDFCQSTNPTVASIQVNETGVIWYNAPTGGTVVTSTTPLVTGTYYGVLVDPISGCESSVRLAVAVQVNDAPTPTTNDTTQDFCQSTNPTVASIQVNETGVIWYNAPTGGTVVTSTTPLVTGTYYGVLVDATSGCESSVRLAVAVQVNDAPTPTTNDTTQDFCQSTNPTVASIQVNETGVIWYNALTGGTVVTSTTPLVTGTYYGVLVDATSGCESSVRLAVAVQINDAPTPTTNDTTQDFCQSTNPTVASIQVNETGVIWYNAPTGGTVVTSTTPLVTGTYYGVLVDPTSGCESSVRLAVAVQVNDAPTPTTNDTTQDFCQSTNPTVASIQVNETGVIWYNAPTGGTVVTSTTPLVTGTYYGVLVDATSGCESSVRLAVAVQVNDAPTPTTNDTTQDFCQSTNPTVASIQVNETGVIWYNAPTGGTVVTSTTPLVSGTTYYGALVDAASGCESSVRLAVSVQVNDAPTPTTNDTTQDFCKSTNPTVASIQVNETGVIWYNAPTGGTVVSGTTPLVTGTYYGVLVDAASGCESSVRLAVAVQVNDAPTPTTNDTTQDFCQTANPTVASIQVNETGVIWYSTPTGGTAIAASTPLTAGTYYGVLVDPTTGCESSVRLAVTVQFFNGTQATISGGSPTACIQDQVTYTTNTGMSNYVWVVTGGGQIVNGGTATDNTITVLWNQIGANTVNVSYSDANGCSTSNSAAMNLNVINCSDITITKTVDNPTPFIDDNVVFTITVTNTGQAQFQNIIVNEAIPSGYGFVSMVVSNGTYNNNTGIWTIPTLNANGVATLQLTVKVLFSGDYLNTATIASSEPTDVDVDNNTASASVEPKCLVVYNEFTPNEDGANDVFTIKCAEHFPNNTLEVYNRYGNLVYKTRYYQNDWKGISNVNGTFDGTVLPTGTYYYVFDTGDNSSTVKTGWVYIMR
ncbi:Ig-like domain-containing protein [Flavobacterium cerinum]|uniref:Gliding motility-associated C-terminal domain-containing protein n=1 Tax=Flavobacterium cerinum TaxID=2502784 RepID=A0ABY5IR30_9FLAO|nr:gliding motility-associated C-terminal domain-containing protein [Flavobacterium cerinum]UUC44647.1 gliding motility-associated C-terminal domain-containing protein [Flavobacterium cerinum]